MKRHDITNQKFNKLTAVEYVKGKVGIKAKWLCFCDCGNTRLVDTNALMNGTLKNCGKCHDGNRGKYADLTSLTFGRWFVIKLYGYDKYNKPLYLCRCKCGTEKTVPKQALIDSSSRSCGCLQLDTATKHNETKTRLYSIWHNMKDRCYREKHHSYHRYGGRGIKVCDEWLHDFMAFKKWAYENGYDDKAKRGVHTIERINNDGNYEPSNCKWISIQEQYKNRCVKNQYMK